MLIAEDDDDARALVTKERIDVLLSDIGMPDTDGCQPIREPRLLPSRQGESVPPAELTTVVGSLATRRGR